MSHFYLWRYYCLFFFRFRAHSNLVFRSRAPTLTLTLLKMSLPLFSDIGKEVKDLFEKNFYFDCVKMEMKNLIAGPMNYQGNQKYSIKDGKMSGEVEGKYEADGITITSKINTESSAISFDAKVNQPIFKGLGAFVSGTFNPGDSKKSINYGLNYCSSDYNFEVVEADILVRANGVFNMLGQLFGVSGVVDPSGFKITNLVGGFHGGRTSFFVNCDPQQKQVTGSVYNVVSSNILTGLVYSLGGNSGGAAGGAGAGGQPTLAFCASYMFNDGATLKARINNDYMVGLAYVLKVKPGINVTMCTEVDAQKLKQGGHKMGFGVEFA